jgi:hypothetical protein
VLDVRTIRYRVGTREGGRLQQFFADTYRMEAKTICLPSGDQLGKAAPCNAAFPARCDAAAEPPGDTAQAASATTTTINTAT